MLERWREAVWGREWLRQVLLFAAAYLAYEIARWITAGDEATAMVNAHRILDLEVGMGIDVEAGVQNALIGLPVMTLLNVSYLAAQLAAVPLALAWTYRRHRHVYFPLRNAVLGTWLISVPIYALFPVAPPRLADLGFADTVSTSIIALDSNFSTLFYNPFAAVPSLHVGFAFAIGIAVSSCTRRWALRAVALAWGPLITLAVVATGNHYIFDALAGLAVTAAGAGIGLAFLERDEQEPAVDARPA